MRQLLCIWNTIFLVVGSPAAFSGNINDGPYVFEKEKNRQVIWICEGQKIVATTDLKVPKVLHGCNGEAKLWQAIPQEAEVLEYVGKFKIAAASDIHGQFDLFIRLLKNNKVIDQNGRWNFKNGHFVITGDIFDRGEQVTEALWFLYDLEKQAEQAGGKLHLLLGNHEVMVLNGDLRYLNEKYVEVEKILNISYPDLFAKGSVLGDWLRSRPVLIKINGMLFAHGGFHPNLVEQKLSTQAINQHFKQNLVLAELAEKRTELGEYLHKTNGPIWYRGYFREGEVSELELNQLLSHFGITHIIVGHTTQETIKSVHKGRVIAIDAGMKDGSYGEILFWNSGKFTRNTLSGESYPVEEGAHLIEAE